MSSEANGVRAFLRGVAAGLLTPFNDDGAIRYEKIAENARALYDDGVRTFLAAANISEYHSLSRAERIAVVETSVGALPKDTCVLAGVGGATGNARDLLAAYDEVGVTL